MVIDGGKNFGKWKDNASKFLYHTSIQEILKRFDIGQYKSIADYGGGNGILKQYIPGIITIDTDETKQPDIKDNILTHTARYDLIVIRYVLHYLNDYQVLDLFNQIAKNKTDNVLVIQFTNEELKAKYFNSVNEFKYFRTKEQLLSLLPVKIQEVYSKTIEITKEFYLNRLKNKNGISHNEAINAFLIKR